MKGLSELMHFEVLVKDRLKWPWQHRLFGISFVMVANTFMKLQKPRSIPISRRAYQKLLMPNEERMRMNDLPGQMEDLMHRHGGRNRLLIGRQRKVIQ